MSDRIAEEWSFMRVNEISNIRVALRENNLRNWIITLTGPTSTPFAGGLFTFYMDFPEGYPTTPPRLHCTTKIYHMNVDPIDGRVCHDILEKEYKPDLKVWGILNCINHLLCEPNPNSPLDGRIAYEYFTNYPLYLEKAIKCTLDYAK